MALRTLNIVRGIKSIGKLHSATLMIMVKTKNFTNWNIRDVKIVAKISKGTSTSLLHERNLKRGLYNQNKKEAEIKYFRQET